MARRPFLLISRVGPRSLHPHWMDRGSDRSFDLLLSAYGDTMTPLEKDGVIFERRAGAKVAGYGAVLRDHRDLIAQYEHVALFDDDLFIDSESIDRLFEIAARYRIKVAQPALTADSHYTYAALLQHPGLLLRYVTYVEMMCPIFRRDALERVAPLFDLGFESGIDIIWSNLLWEGPRDLAVIDAVAVCHTQRVGRAKAANGFVGGRRYEDDIHAMLDRFECPWLPCLPYGAVRADGREVMGRAATALAAAGLVHAVPRQKPFKRRARNLLVYWKHMLSAPARNQRLTLSS